MPLSGKEMLKLYQRAGWIYLRQTGSHVHVLKEGMHECIPMHKELRTGMERYLLKRLERTK
jgi:predicted RNA binding protein YcfA (HicA-like mRNA interferase family)